MNAPLTHAIAQTLDADARLFQPGRIGDIEIANRVVMAPLTRSRADEPRGDIPGSVMNIEYYRQRSNAGLIISEGTQVSPTGKGYMATPGIYSDAQVEGWKPITRAVHEAGSKILAQIWHVGRITHPGLTGGTQPVAARSKYRCRMRCPSSRSQRWWRSTAVARPTQFGLASMA